MTGKSERRLFKLKNMKAQLEITPTQTIDIELDLMPHRQDEWVFDGMIYFVHNIKWDHTTFEIPGVGKNTVYKPTIVIHEPTYLQPKELHKD